MKVLSARRQKRKLRKLLKEYIYCYLSNRCCLDCGLKDIRVLEFDHVGKKKHGISQLVNKGVPIEYVLQEIAECEVVCCNCHRIRTLQRSKSYRIK